MDRGNISLRAALAVLGLEPGADRDAATEAYRRLAKAHHPDVSPDADAAEQFAAIAAAYQQVLAAPPGRVEGEPGRRPARSRPIRWQEQVGGPVIVAGPVHVEPPRGGRRWI
jgi:curved DNA-binding protein